jgi:hypothetical protein
LRSILAGTRPANSENRECGKQRRPADSQPTRPDITQAELPWLLW